MLTKRQPHQNRLSSHRKTIASNQITHRPTSSRQTKSRLTSKNIQNLYKSPQVTTKRNTLIDRSKVLLSQPFSNIENLSTSVISQNDIRNKKSKEENIQVAVRVRPMQQKESK